MRSNSPSSDSKEASEYCWRTSPATTVLRILRTTDSELEVTSFRVVIPLHASGLADDGGSERLVMLVLCR